MNFANLFFQSSLELPIIPERTAVLLVSTRMITEDPLTSSGFLSASFSFSLQKTSFFWVLVRRFCFVIETLSHIFPNFGRFFSILFFIRQCWERGIYFSLDIPPRNGYNKIQRAPQQAAGYTLGLCGLLLSPKTRHFAEWRVFLWVKRIIIVTVNGPMWNVIRIRHHLLSEMIASHLYRCYGALCPWWVTRFPGLSIFYMIRAALSIPGRKGNLFFAWHSPRNGYNPEFVSWKAVKSPEPFENTRVLAFGSLSKNVVLLAYWILCFNYTCAYYYTGIISVCKHLFYYGVLHFWDSYLTVKT